MTMMRRGSVFRGLKVSCIFIFLPLLDRLDPFPQLSHLAHQSVQAFVLQHAGALQDTAHLPAAKEAGAVLITFRRINTHYKASVLPSAAPDG